MNTRVVSRGHFRRALMQAVAAGLLLTSASLASAGRHVVTPLGPTLPSYSEHRMGLNTHDDVAWSELVAGHSHARVTQGGSAVALDLHALAGSPFRSYAEDINDARHVVGYTTTSGRESVRSAALWRWTGSTYQYIDVGAAPQTQVGGQTPGASVAYAISPANAAGNFYVAGYVRTTFSQPALWEVTPAGGVVSMTLLDISGFPNGYGLAHGVTSTGVVVGGAGVSSAYITAVTWSAPNAPAVRIPDVEVAPTTFASSIANRVRRYDMGNGTWVNAAVGHAFVQNSQDVEGFLYILGDTGTDTSFMLAGGTKAALMDVGQMVYPLHGRPTPDMRGLRPVGMSNRGLGTPNDPYAVQTTYGAFGVDLGVHAHVCDLNDALPAAADDLRYIQATNTNGSYAGWQDDGHAVRISRVPASSAVSVFVRDTPMRPGQAQRREFWATHPAASTVGRFIFSNSAGCQQPSGCNDGRYDLSTQGVANSDFYMADVQQQVGSLQVSSRVPLSTIGGLYPSARFAWMQASGTTGATTCTMTDVQAVQESVNPPGADFWGGFWCDFQPSVAGAETNIREALSHCGAGTDCNQTSNAVDLYSCTDDLCDNGVVKNPIQPNRCLINGLCKTRGDRDTVTLPIILSPSSDTICGNAAPQVTVANPCVTCNPGTTEASKTNWTNNTSAPCCDSNATPYLDVYDRTRHQQANANSCNANHFGIDKNHGFSRGAWWVDPRNLNGTAWNDWGAYTQGSYWSVNGQCNLGSSSTEPQDLPKLPGSVPSSQGTSYGHVRRIQGSFTPGIDMHDWYGTVMDDNGNSATTPKPRGRLISRNDHPTENRKVRMQMCIYVDCMRGGRGNVDIKDVRFRNTGRGHFYTSTSSSTANHPANAQTVNLGSLSNPGGSTGGSIIRRWMFDHTSGNQWTQATVNGATRYYWNPPYLAHDFSPAHDARGPCFETDDNGILDISINDYDCTQDNREEAWMYYYVRLVDTDLNAATCSDATYTLYYGNDRQSGAKISMLADHDSGWQMGCDTCCN